MGGAVSLDWLVIFAKAKKLKFKLKPTDIEKLEIIEEIIIAHINKKNS